MDPFDPIYLVGATTISITTFSIMTFSMMAHSIATLCVTTVSIQYSQHNSTIKHNDTEQNC
jgi:hypothetical protein